MKKNAFTLAEVLITLGIIGVVSALTLPTLVKNHQRQVYTVQLKKVYNELSQAAEQVKTDSNAVNLKESQLRRSGSSYLLTHYFKTTQTCSTSSLSSCFASQYANMNGTNVSISNFVPSGGSCAVISSGASICVGSLNSSGSINVATDINGKEGPNIVGRDLFTLVILNDGTISNDGTASTSACKNSTSAGTYDACLAQIIQDGWKMDY
jgi:prepilin-type N-terminal cleavage/methylation domain-containing protein